MKPRIIHILSSLIYITLFITSCSDESGLRYPSVTTHMVVADVDSDGNVNNILVDNGNNFFVSKNNRGPFSAIKDTRVRAIAKYEPFYEQMEAIIYDIAPTQVVFPYGPHQIGFYEQDPAELVRIWKGGEFLNIELAIPAINLAKHRLAFVDNSLDIYSNIVKLEFYHRNEEGPLAIMKNLIVSIPLSIYYDRFQGESFKLVFKLKTKDGFKDYEVNIGAL
ncbi:hypothetical protein [Bacteroides propionicifaciens]|jgi:hypothetical protein|uniref:NigD1/NigD2 family lipoprotein n=1 Tax=Bacteroides propionicifaciens TaxID=392838 RepID=UPI00046A4314|nr:NigD-like C-terminal domain-containing protein [Bacteroides propionicifaciens]